MNESFNPIQSDEDTKFKKNCNGPIFLKKTRKGIIETYRTLPYICKIPGTWNTYQYFGRYQYIPYSRCTVDTHTTNHPPTHKQTNQPTNIQTHKTETHTHTKRTIHRYHKSNLCSTGVRFGTNHGKICICSSLSGTFLEYIYIYIYMYRDVGGTVRSFVMDGPRWGWQWPAVIVPREAWTWAWTWAWHI